MRFYLDTSLLVSALTNEAATLHVQTPTISRNPSPPARSPGSLERATDGAQLKLNEPQVSHDGWIGGVTRLFPVAQPTERELVALREIGLIQAGAFPNLRIIIAVSFLSAGASPSRSPAPRERHTQADAVDHADNVETRLPANVFLVEQIIRLPPVADACLASPPQLSTLSPSS